MEKAQNFDEFEISLNMGELTTEERAIASSAFLNNLSPEHARSIIKAVNNRRDLLKNHDLDNKQDFDDWYALLDLEEARETEEANEDKFLAYCLWVDKCGFAKAKKIIEDTRGYRMQNRPSTLEGGM